MTSDRWKDSRGRGGGNTRKGKERAREAREGESGKKKKEEKKRRSKKRERNNTSTSFLSRLSGPCVSSLELLPGNLIPFSIYLNPFTQTPRYQRRVLPDFFSPFLRAFRPAPRARYTGGMPLLFVSLRGAQLPFHSSSPSERRHTFPPLLVSFTNVASRESSGGS